MSKSHLNILVQLAKVDGIVVQEEVDLINEVGKANGMTEEEIASSFEEELPIGDLSTLTDDEKYDLIYSIVQLMKIDGKLYNEEIKFCAKMSAKLGYEEDVLFELMLKIYADPDLCADKESLKKQIQKFLIP
ncbi:MAG: TerB family tellurite resistance protein [Reichenbachiella sp.]|uniref:TerB family tellurite resistance protein n=1 Tax=Reichenbachiella sp. TaxID=2184521 RepID=UPI002965F03F|nr:TerB family tellurite resistance protein [Reichenbachiella sp.]MDW3209274.1 TerB family tellurite resistance protein [Reichenbachiella sp.]